MKKVIFLIFLFAFTYSLFALKYYVKLTGNDANDGLSWTTAKSSIAGVLTPATYGDTIFVAVGVHVHGGLIFKSGLSIFGGFMGFETELNERPAMNYGVTEYGQFSEIRNSNNGSTGSINLSGNFANLVIFDGFVIRILGVVDNGINLGSNVLLRNCMITGASRRGLHVAGNSTVVNCMITNNGWRDESSFYDAGGVLVSSGNATFTDCIIDGNLGSHGAIFIGTATATFKDCSINNNEGIYSGAIRVNDNGNLNLINCFIANNKAWYSTTTSIIAGGIQITGTARIVGCIIANNTATNTHNFGYFTAGGVYSTSIAFLEIINSHIVNNLAETNHVNFAGGVYINNANTYLTNCLVWGNKKGNQFSQFFGTPHVINYSAIQGISQTGVGNINLAETNIGSESGIFYPRFANPSLFAGSATNSTDSLQVMQANWRLTQGSACIDRGIPNVSGLELPETDIYGAPRVFNERIDIGAAEYAFFSQEIEWDQTLHFSIHENSIELTATATSGLPVNYTSNNLNVAFINGNILTIVGAGTATITAKQAGNAVFEPATDVEKVLNVSDVGIDEFEVNKEITIYPNPTTGQLTIESGKLNTSVAEIFDMTGRKVGTYQINLESGESVIDISNLRQGVYFMKADRVILKVIKQ